MNAIAIQPPQALDASAAAEAAAHINSELAITRTIEPAVSLAVRALVDQLLAADVEDWLAIDPHHALLAHRALLEAQEVASIADDIDARNQLRLALGRLTACLHAISENQSTAESRSSKEIVRWLVDSIEVPQKDIADLLGVDLRKLQRWLSDSTAAQPEGEDARRVRTVAKIANQLRHTLTAPGVIAWFDWPAPDLGGKKPAELLVDVSQTPALINSAAEMRSTSFA